LLAYTGWRTFDFLTLQLPASDLSKALALFFLFATEAGLSLWHEIALKHATTQEQQSISTAMTWLDFAGSLAAGIADMILRQSLLEGYTIPALLAYGLLYGLPALVAANVGAVIYYERNDAENQLDRSKKQLKFEITRQALRELKDNQGAIAEGLKRDIFRALRDDVTGKTIRQFIKDDQPAPLKISGNGHNRLERVFPGDTEQAELAETARPLADREGQK
jgi:hypothetical protein